MFGVFSITSSWRPSAEIVIDEEGGLLRNTLASYYNHDEQMMFTEQLRLLASSGVPYDTWLADDFIRKPELAEKYRVIVFAGMYSIDESRRKLIKRLKNGGRTLVFLSGTGISGGDDATGLKLVHQRAPRWKHFMGVLVCVIYDRKKYDLRRRVNAGGKDAVYHLYVCVQGFSLFLNVLYHSREAFWAVVFFCRTPIRLVDI